MDQPYTPECVQRLRRDARRDTLIAAAWGLAALLICIALCLHIRTANAPRRQALTIIFSFLGAGGAVLLWTRGRLPRLREAAHQEGVLRAPREPLQGTLREIGAPHPIPRSITFLPLTVETEAGVLPVKVNAVWAKALPPVGTPLRGEVRRGYLTRWEKDASGDAPAFRAKSPLPLGTLLGCLILSVLLWSWIFTFLTDADPARKITLFADMRDMQARTLSIALEEDAPEGIRFVQAHPFSYALMDSASLENADLYIMTEAQAQEHPDWILPEEKLLLYSPESGQSSAASCLSYDEAPGESWFLYYGAKSLHHGTLDEAADAIAARLLTLP